MANIVLDTIAPDLSGNRCHIAPEFAGKSGQTLWLALAPYGGRSLKFRGEPTSVLYAAAPTIAAVRGDWDADGPLSDLTMEDDVALITPTRGGPEFCQEFRDRLREQNLRAFCVGTLTAGCVEARNMAMIVRQEAPDAAIIFGGPHEDDIDVPTAIDPELDGVADFSVSGDGEYALHFLLTELFRDRSAPVREVKRRIAQLGDRVAALPGRGTISFFHEARAVRLALSSSRLALDSMPLMPRELVHESDTRTFSVFRNNGWASKTAQIMTHRGCAWKCSFCSESQTVVERSISSLCDELRQVSRFDQCARGVDRAPYEAVFFDDSTFTWASPRRRRLLSELFAELRSLGMEWGCQTRLDSINDYELLREMADSGCTYIFCGLESSSNEMLRAMRKRQSLSDIERGLDVATKAGIRLGLSLIFGVAGRGAHITSESTTTIEDTIEYTRRQVDRANVVAVTANLATYYPGTTMSKDATNSLTPLTRMGGAVARRGSTRQMDFRYPIITPHYPWNRFEEGESYHPQGVNREMAEFILTKAQRLLGERLVQQDLYDVPEVARANRLGLLTSERGRKVNLNHASITEPLSAAVAAANEAARRPATAEEAAAACEEARHWAARLFGLPPEEARYILLGRNTTHAISMARYLTGLAPDQGDAAVVTTTAGNLSVPRAFAVDMDHGNSQGLDPWSSFQDFAVRRSASVRSPARRLSGIGVREVDIDKDEQKFEQRLLDAIRPETRLVVFCHVLRGTGRIVDVRRLCERIREAAPDARILIDGAQSAGALPRLCVAELGCDMYAATPHKTIGSHVLGLMWLGERARPGLDALRHLPSARDDGSAVCPGMFARDLGIPPCEHLAPMSLPEVRSFSAACRWLSDTRFGDNTFDGVLRELDGHRHRLREEFSQALLQTAQAHDFTVSPTFFGTDRQSHFILSFCVDQMDNREIAQRLWADHLVFVSYIARENRIRVSFGVENTLKDVAYAAQCIGLAVQSVREEGCHTSHGALPGATVDAARSRRGARS